MASIPEPENNTTSLIDRYHEELSELPRHHLGFSLLGHPCDRWLWLSFRWAVREEFPGRIKRLFRRGHDEEFSAASDLRAIGVELRETGRYQRTIYAGSHVQGSPDGIIYSGLPEAPKTMHVWECKTHSKKSFEELKKKGVEKAKWQHYVQMQCSMTRANISRALYYAVCKDDDRLYTERVYIDRTVGEKYMERGRRIALSERIPEPLSADPSWYQCKFCAAHPFCFEERSTQEVNCRTCAHATPESSSTWTCARWGAEIPKDAQYTGCRSHVFHPDLVPWKMTPCDEWNCFYDGELNGEKGTSSLELLHGIAGRVAQVFGGEIQ